MQIDLDNVVFVKRFTARVKRGRQSLLVIYQAGDPGYGWELSCVQEGPCDEWRRWVEMTGGAGLPPSKAAPRIRYKRYGYAAKATRPRGAIWQTLHDTAIEFAESLRGETVNAAEA